MDAIAHVVLSSLLSEAYDPPRHAYVILSYGSPPLARVDRHLSGRALIRVMRYCLTWNLGNLGHLADWDFPCLVFKADLQL